MIKYKVFFHVGEELGLKTGVSKGRAWLDDAGLNVEGPSGVTIPIDDFRSVSMFRLHGLGRVIQIDHVNGRLYVSVVRLMIGQFAFINYFKTGHLFKDLSSVANRSET
jgi:hypothetical protein